MNKRISRHMTKELIEAVRLRYLEASKLEKKRILDEFVAISGYHRKHAIRLLRAYERQTPHVPTGGRRIYDDAVREALVVLWEAADRICSKRLKATIPSLIEAMEHHGHLKLAPLVRDRLLSMSASTIDRLLSPIRGEAGPRRRKRRVTKASKQIPVRTFSDWQEPEPGFLEIDFVLHCGTSVAGTYLSSLVATDIHSGWVETVPLMAREQMLVIEGLNAICRRMPVPVLGIDTDNDSSFINDTLLEYCQQQDIEFTRCRPYQKNDQAWIEQKNGSVIRRFVGYDRHSGVVAGQALAHMFQSMRLYVNYFQPSLKLKAKKRLGSKTRRTYYPPKTPCDRLLEHTAVEDKHKIAMRSERSRLDPLELLQHIREGQASLAALAAGDALNAPERETLDEFLATLPHLWKSGEVRPTHQHQSNKPRYWRIRKDPFEAVWTEVLLWLQAEPDATAKVLFDRLREKYPGRFQDGQLRTLQRRVHDWRRVMARKLLFGTEDESEEDAVLIGAGHTSKDACDSLAS